MYRPSPIETHMSTTCKLSEAHRAKIEECVRMYLRYCHNYRETITAQLLLELRGVDTDEFDKCWDEVERQLII